MVNHINMANYIIDIGSNIGDITKEYIKDSNNFVISIEPIPHLYNVLKGMELDYQNLKVINCAVSNVEGQQTFYLNEPDCTSSLKKFNDTVRNNWPNKLNYNVEITVDVKKMSTIIEELSLEDVIFEFVKIDTQGSDLDVIKSIDRFLSNVKTLKCEAFLTSKKNDLYDEEGKSNEIIDYMIDNNFILIDNEINPTELWCDLTFRNKKFI
jgi:FkbM family methyltransferase